MSHIALHIGNMICDGCKATVRKALLHVDASRFRIAGTNRAIRRPGYKPDEEALCART